LYYGALRLVKDEAPNILAHLFSRARNERPSCNLQHQGADLWCDIAIFLSKGKIV